MSTMWAEMAHTIGVLGGICFMSGSCLISGVVNNSFFRRIHHKSLLSMIQKKWLPFLIAASLLILASVISPSAYSQMPQRQPTPNDTLKSPQVYADHRVKISI